MLEPPIQQCYLTRIRLYTLYCNTDWQYIYTRRSGHYAPILLAPAVGWGALQATRALWALLGAFGPSSVGEASKQNILN